jgi:hypothetical protein
MYTSYTGPLKFDVTITFSGGMDRKKQRKECYTLDLAGYKSLAFDQQADMNDIVKQLEKIDSSLTDSTLVLQRLSTIEAAIRHIQTVPAADTATSLQPIPPDPLYRDLLMKLVRYQWEHGATRFEFAIHESDYKTLVVSALKGEGSETSTERIFTHPNIDPLILWREDQYIRVMEQIRDVLYYVRLTPAAMRIENTATDQSYQPNKRTAKSMEIVRPRGILSFISRFWLHTL